MNLVVQNCCIKHLLKFIMFLGVYFGTCAIKLLVINDSNSVLAVSNISLDVSRPHNNLQPQSI